MPLWQRRRLAITVSAAATDRSSVAAPADYRRSPSRALGGDASPRQPGSHQTRAPRRSRSSIASRRTTGRGGRFPLTPNGEGSRVPQPLPGRRASPTVGGGGDSPQWRNRAAATQRSRRHGRAGGSGGGAAASTKSDGERRRGVSHRGGGRDVGGSLRAGGARSGASRVLRAPTHGWAPAGAESCAAPIYAAGAGSLHVTAVVVPCAPLQAGTERGRRASLRLRLRLEPLPRGAEGMGGALLGFQKARIARRSHVAATQERQV